MRPSVQTINMRTDAERKRRLQIAADLAHESLTSFVLSAADERAALDRDVFRHVSAYVPLLVIHGREDVKRTGAMPARLGPPNS